MLKEKRKKRKTEKEMVDYDLKVKDKWRFGTWVVEFQRRILFLFQLESIKN